MKRKLTLVIALLAIIFSATNTVSAQDYSISKGEKKEKAATTAATATVASKKSNKDNNVSELRFATERPTGNVEFAGGTVPTTRSTTTTFPFTESFDANTFPPTGWAQYHIAGNATNTYLWARSTNSSYRHSGAGAAYHRDGPSGMPQEDWLVTPVINIPATGIYALNFWSYNVYPTYYGYNGVLISEGSGDPASGDFVEVWHPASVTGPFVETELFLSDYAGKDIYIAFVYKGTYAHGWALDDVKVDEIIIPASDVSITKTSVGYTQVPLRHAADISFKASVYNSGADIASPFALNVTANNPENYSGSATISSLGFKATAADVAVSPGFTTTTKGTYTATFNLPFSDVTPANNTATASFSITESTFAKDNGTFIGGLGSTNPLVFGHVFELKQPDLIGSFSLTFGSNASELFKVRIYSVNEAETSVTELIYESGDFQRSDAGVAGTLKEYAIAPQFLPAGKYLFAVNQYLGANISIAYDNVPNALVYLLSGTVLQPNTQFGNVAIRVNTSPLPALDAAITAITEPVSSDNLTNAESVKVTITNSGTNAISGFDLSLYLDETLVATETYSGSIGSFSSADYTFTATVDLSEVKAYTIKAKVTLSGDEIAGNNEFIKTVSHLKPNVELSGYRIYEDGGTVLSIVSFYSNTPQTVTLTNSYKDGSNSVASAEYYDDKYYLFTRNSSTSAPANFVVLSTTDWSEISKTPITAVPNDLTYDYSDQKLYAVSGSPSVLSTVDLTTGAFTTVATLDRYLYTLSADLSGVLYGVDNTGKLVTVNKVSGATTEVGNTGVTPKYIQSAAFDHNTGRLFWAASNSSEEGKLIELNPATGAVESDFGLLGGNIELVGLYTPYTHVAVSSKTPAEDAVVAVDATVSVTFTDNSKVVEGDLAGITIQYENNNSVAVTPSLTGKVLTIGHADFAYNKAYTVTVPVTAISDLKQAITWSFSTGIAAITGEVVSPEVNDYAELDEPIIVAFDKDIATNGAPDFSNAVLIAEDASEIALTTTSTSGTSVTFTHPELSYNSAYTVFIPAAAVVGLTGDIQSEFTTKIAAITGEVVSPEAGAEGVELDEPIVVVFDKDIATNGAPDFSNAVLIAEDESEIALTTTSTSGTDVTFAHPELSYGSAYTVFIPAAAVIGLTGDVVSGFSTKLIPLVIDDQAPTGIDVALDAAVTATFNRAISLITPKAKATIVPSTGADEGVLSLGEGGTVLNVSHAAFAPNTAYTITVPDVAIIGWFTPIVWSFTTEKGEGINDVKASAAVYPTLSKGQITVNTTANATVKIADLSGRVLATYRSTGTLPINLNYANGVYFVVIENGKTVTTHKVVLQK